jgi:hypothetical protein
MADTTQQIAMIAGAYLTVTGLGFLVSMDFYARMTAMGDRSDPVLLNLSGATHFIVGAIILSLHFRWATAPEIIVTLVGIAAVLKGLALIIVPEVTLMSPPQSKTFLRINAAGFLLVGVFLSVTGFGLSMPDLFS